MANPQNLRHDSAHCKRISKIRNAKYWKPITDRFWEKVIKGTPSECWEWSGSISGNGRPSLMFEGKHLVAARVAYEIANGSFDKSLCVLHRCDNGMCVNPGHLFLGTKADNIKDMDAKNRRGKLFGDDHHNTIYSDSMVAEIKRLYVPRKFSGTKIAKHFKIPLRAVYTCLYR